MHLVKVGRSLLFLEMVMEEGTLLEVRASEAHVIGRWLNPTLQWLRSCVLVVQMNFEFLLTVYLRTNYADVMPMKRALAAEQTNIAPLCVFLAKRLCRLYADWSQRFRHKRSHTSPRDCRDRHIVLSNPLALQELWGLPTTATEMSSHFWREIGILFVHARSRT